MTIHRTSEIHPGERRDQLPDLLVTWNQVGGELARVSSPDIGELRNENLSFRTGDHQPDGIFFAEGPMIDSCGDIGLVTAEDFVPTFAAFLGAELPVTDGAPIPIFAGASTDGTPTKPQPVRV